MRALAPFPQDVREHDALCIDDYIRALLNGVRLTPEQRDVLRSQCEAVVASVDYVHDAVGLPRASDKDTSSMTRERVLGVESVGHRGHGGPP